MLKSLLSKPLRFGLLLLAIAGATSFIAPEFWKKLFSTQGFMPQGDSYLWRPEVVWLHAGSDILIGLSYVAIPRRWPTSSTRRAGKFRFTG